jgi:hypothetical protein
MLTELLASTSTTMPCSQKVWLRHCVIQAMYLMLTELLVLLLLCAISMSCSQKGCNLIVQAASAIVIATVLGITTGSCRLWTTTAGDSEGSDVLMSERIEVLVEGVHPERPPSQGHNPGLPRRSSCFKLLLPSSSTSTTGSFIASGSCMTNFSVALFFFTFTLCLLY